MTQVFDYWKKKLFSLEKSLTDVKICSFCSINRIIYYLHSFLKHFYLRKSEVFSVFKKEVKI